jgi:putative transposase
MPSAARIAPGDIAYHALNRAVARLPLFEKEADFEAFERVLHEAHQRTPSRVLAYCVIPNHWHFVLWPKADGELTRFLRWLTHTHTMRWHAHHHTGGTGHLYQGRFKAFPVQSDAHLLTVLRYVERNAVRAKSGQACRGLDMVQRLASHYKATASSSLCFPGGQSTRPPTGPPG